MTTTIRASRRTRGQPVLLALAIFLASAAIAQDRAEQVTVLQTRGVDQRVNYLSLQKFGPWDDRNYNLTAEDLTYLSDNENELQNNLPAFFRVELRKEMPHLRKSGPAQYPRAALQLFGIRYGGLMQNGRILNDRRVRMRKPGTVGREVQLNQILGANEITVEINPVNPDQVIAGANNAGGQEMYYSTDGGVTWTIQGVLPNTCCDPTVDWSSDGSVAFVGALSGPIGVSTWRSFDGGQTWVDRVDITASGSDKEFIHVDRSATSPFQDNLYVTYHDANTMQFARSTDQGASYDIQAFPAAPLGIGSDITTDSAGNIYYAYGAFGNATVTVLKSNDGGDTFGSPVTVANTNGIFDFPIPSMETRRAWVYAAIDADRSGGTFDGSIYISWTDTVDPETNDPNVNHTRVFVAYSRDGGASWTLTTPHATDDMDTVDRWNQWMTVDDFGNVHVVFYDTRNSVNRTGVDLYYSYSSDGGQTWADPERVSSATSANLTDGQEFGDYNGISVFQDTVISTWTDNRDGPPNMKDVYADDAPNVVAEPGFIFSAAPDEHSVCSLTSLDDITVSVGSALGFVDPVTLNLANLPAGFSGGFTVNPVTPSQPPNVSLAQVSVGAVASGDYSFDIVGSATGVDDQSLAINVSVADAAPGAATLLAPLDGAVDESTAPLLTWSAVAGATSYTVELDDDPAFGSIDFTTQTTDTSVTPSPTLLSMTTYYWRVRAENPCGASVDSATFSFTTGVEICSTTFGGIPDGDPFGTSETMMVSDTGVLADLNVSLLISHTWVGDLDVRLIHEDTGTFVQIIDRPGVPALGTFGCPNDDVDATLDDEGTALVEDQCNLSPPAIAGNLIPNSLLSAFDGEDLSGSWRLDAIDPVTPDPGTIHKWCLIPTLSGGDDDNDGVPNENDQCPATAAGATVTSLGCSSAQLDFDGDGVPHSLDRCPNTPQGANVDANGCSAGQLDLDGDGVENNLDLCPNTAPGEQVDGDGCSANQVGPDDDGDGVFNAFDQCPNTAPGAGVNAQGCSGAQIDEDGDGVTHNLDMCPHTPVNEVADADGCSESQRDFDGDGIENRMDRCPATPFGSPVNAAGCSSIQLDVVGDGSVDDLRLGGDGNRRGDTWRATRVLEREDAAGDARKDAGSTVMSTDDVPVEPAPRQSDGSGAPAETIQDRVAPGRESDIGSYRLDDDGDGLPNGTDNCTAVANDDQRDSNGDGFGNMCDADLNNDGIVNAADRDMFESVLETADQDADFNGDGIVDALDWQIMDGRMDHAPGPSGLLP